jgi:glycosyltransferase involved in cell wall biosynthesis
VPRVTTVHDLHYRLVPDAHFGIRGLGMRVLVPAAVRRSRRVIADAWSTRADLVRLLGTSPDKIDVVPLGVAAPGETAPTPEPQLRRRLDLGGGPVLLTVSAKRPHKNLAPLLRAHACIPSQRRPVLVVPGYPTPHERELRELARDLGSAGWVRFPAWVSPEDLEGLYVIALGFVFPSLYEGFGLPVLEAMRRGVPVACSDRSSLPEVAGEAALLFDPTDEVAMASALARLLDDEPLRRRLRVAGPERAARFTWDATAAATLATYRRALG